MLSNGKDLPINSKKKIYDKLYKSSILEIFRSFPSAMGSFLQNIIETISLFWIFAQGSLSFIRYKYFEYHTSENEENIDGKVVVITGAQRGMGKAAAVEFAKRGAIVVMGCVDLREGRQALEEIKTITGNPNIALIHLDLSEMASVREFALTVRKKYPEIKILLNNAGLGAAPEGNVKTKDGFNLHVAVNHLGHFLLTNLLIPNFKRGSRVVSMSSTLQLLAKLDLNDLMLDNSDLLLAFDSGLPYANTKFANALFIKELGRRLEGTGVTTYALCPGIVRTTIFTETSKTVQRSMSLFGNIIASSPQEACNGILYCALDKEIRDETGQMYRFKKHFKRANDGLDAKLAKDLWELSAKLVNLERQD